MMFYAATTNDVTVTARPVYLDGQSNAIEHKFVFAYFILINNNGTETIQLLRRHWYIIDGNGTVEEVEGDGVVGQQPIILPGESHDYASFCVLKTFEGSMEGTYLMRKFNGGQIEVAIPRFLLRAAAN